MHSRSIVLFTTCVFFTSIGHALNLLHVTNLSVRDDLYHPVLEARTNGGKQPSKSPPRSQSLDGSQPGSPRSPYGQQSQRVPQPTSPDRANTVSGLTSAFARLSHEPPQRQPPGRSGPGSQDTRTGASSPVRPPRNVSPNRAGVERSASNNSPARSDSDRSEGGIFRTYSSDSDHYNSIKATARGPATLDMTGGAKNVQIDDESRLTQKVRALHAKARIRADPNQSAPQSRLAEVVAKGGRARVTVDSREPGTFGGKLVGWGREGSREQTVRPGEKATMVSTGIIDENGFYAQRGKVKGSLSEGGSLSASVHNESRRRPKSGSGSESEGGAS